MLTAKYSRPANEAEAAMRFDVLEVHYDVPHGQERALLRARLPGWAVQPLETVPLDELDFVEE